MAVQGRVVTSSSPSHVKSDSKAEAAVRAAKAIFKKAYRENEDPSKTQPTHNSSPVERRHDVTKNAVTHIKKISILKRRRRCQGKIKGQEEIANSYQEDNNNNIII